MTHELRKPSFELATRILRELEYEERLTGCFLQASGSMPLDLFSFESAVNLLDADNTKDFDPNELMANSRQVRIAWVNPRTLRGWVEEVFDDQQLGQAIAETLSAAEGRSYPEVIQPIVSLLKQRLSQCKDIIERSVS